MADQPINSSTATLVFAYHNMGVIGLKALCRYGYNIAAVFTHEDDPNENRWFRSVADFCASEGIPCHKPPDVNQECWIDMIRSLEPRFISSFYYRNLLSQEVLDLAPGRAFNLHGSLLPRYRGRAPVNWAILNGETETGVTLHHMVERADAGDIVGQKRIPIGETDTALDVYRKLEPTAEELLDDLLPMIQYGTAPRIPQDETQASVYGRRRPEDGRIDWNQPGHEIYNLIRAVTHPYPGAFSTLRGDKLDIWWAVLDDTIDDLAPGQLLVHDAVALVGTGDRAIRLDDIAYKGSEVKGLELVQILKEHSGKQLV